MQYYVVMSFLELSRNNSWIIIVTTKAFSNSWSRYFIEYTFIIIIIIIINEYTVSLHV